MEKIDIEHRDRKLETRALNDKEAAIYIGMSESFLRQCRVSNTDSRKAIGPSYIKIGRAVRYLKEDLDVWLEEHRK